MFTLNCKGRLLLIDEPLVMGIVNITPDSFYEGSRFTGTDAILSHAENLLLEGADIIDIGGQSTRPHAPFLSPDEELNRVINPLRSLHQHFPEAIISIDSFHSIVARECVMAGASIINDISAGQIDEQMIATAGKLDVPYICMHMKGTPQTMHNETEYKHLTIEVLDFFIKKMEECHQSGIKDIIIDPGFGFSKTISQNFELLKNLSALQILDKPLLVGLSRKATIYKTLGITPEESLNGTTVLNTIGLMNGANILRVHDVKQAKETIRLYRQYSL